MPPSTLSALLLALLAISGVHAAAAGNASIAAGAPTCQNEPFEIVVGGNAPLGLRLSDKLEILEFLVDAQGRRRAVEAAGVAEIGDRLVGVNDVGLTALTFREALAAIQAATAPKTLRFEASGGRCLVGSSSSSSSSASNTTTTTTNRTVEAAPTTSYDYVLVSTGNKLTEEQFYAVPSADGQPPSCLFREVVVAEPEHACTTLLVNASDKYVVIPDLLGCPAHQKAALAQEAGAKGVVFVQRPGEKPQQIRLPRELPKPINLPLVMVSADSGQRILEALDRVPLRQSLQLRFVFREECAAAAFATHPNEDPFQVSVVNRIEAATAGFLSLTVAASGARTLGAAAFEFLKPVPLSASPSFSGAAGTTTAATLAAGLPLGRSPVFFAPSLLNPCEMRSARQPPQLLLWEAEMDGAFVVVPYRVDACSVATHVDFFATRRALGVVLVDPAFPSAASAMASRMSAAQMPIPFVFVSPVSERAMRDEAAAAQAVHLLVEFTGQNALEHQWRDLAALQRVENWPRASRNRERLLHRMLRDQKALSTEEVELSLATNERQETLWSSFERAQEHFASRDNAEDAVMTPGA